jgi:hypothetical protein
MQQFSLGKSLTTKFCLSFLPSHVVLFEIILPSPPMSLSGMRVGVCAGISHGQDWEKLTTKLTKKLILKQKMFCG